MEERVEFLGVLSQLNLSHQEKGDIANNRVILKINNSINQKSLSLLETDAKLQIQSGNDTFYLLNKGDVLTIKTPKDQLSIGVKQDFSLLISKDTHLIDTIRAQLKSEEDYFPERSTEYQAIKWLKNDNLNPAALSMCYHLCGEYIKRKIEIKENKTEFNEHPVNAEDFKQCYDFLNAVPLARPWMLDMVIVSSEWSEIYGVWEKLEATYLDKAIVSKEWAENHVGLGNFDEGKQSEIKPCEVKNSELNRLINEAIERKKFWKTLNKNA